MALWVAVTQLCINQYSSVFGGVSCPAVCKSFKYLNYACLFGAAKEKRETNYGYVFFAYSQCHSSSKPKFSRNINWQFDSDFKIEEKNMIEEGGDTLNINTSEYFVESLARSRVKNRSCYYYILDQKVELPVQQRHLICEFSSRYYVTDA